MSRTVLAVNNELQVEDGSVMKYLIIAALVSIIFVLVYSRVRPYLKLIQKVVQSLNVVTDINTSTAQRRTSRFKEQAGSL